MSSEVLKCHVNRHKIVCKILM